MNDAGKKYDDGLIAQVVAYQQNEGGKPITDEAFGRAIGYSGTTIGRWKKKEYSGEVSEVEARIRDALAAASVRDIDRPKPVKHSLSRVLRGYFENIKRARQIAVVSGEAGIGKTTAVGMYCGEFANSILATVANWTSDERALMRVIYEWGHMAVWTRRGSLGAHVAKCLRQSDRLLIVDNAHKLSGRALGALFDLKDIAEIPIALVANPEIVVRIAQNDQWHSRVGPHKVLRLSEEDAQKVAHRLVDFYAPAATDKFKAMAAATMPQKGHGRRLENRLQMAKRLIEGNPDYSWTEAFEEAGEEMVQIAEEGRDA